MSIVEIAPHDTATRVCRYDDLPTGRGVAALLRDGQQVALFRLDDGTVHAIDQRDPYSGANVMSRGLVGSRGDRDLVHSPMFKQAFDLRTGDALDDTAVTIAVFDVAILDGEVVVSRRTTPTSGLDSQ